MVIQQKRWSGYTFWLTYLGSELTAFEVRREPDAAPLTARALTEVTLGTLDAVARECVDDFLEELSRLNPALLLGPYPDPLDWLDSTADASTGRGDDKKLAKLCARYVELGGKPRWRETLAREFDYKASSVQTIIGRARRRRFLTPAPRRGQYGGQLTPKALRLLAPAEQREAWDRLMSEQRSRAQQHEPAEWRFIRTEDMTPEQLAIARGQEQEREANQ